MRLFLGWGMGVRDPCIGSRKGMHHAERFALTEQAGGEIMGIIFFMYETDITLR